uniref:J domain-containing protein n=1 Tax=Oryza glaberrima TaxID=4538 RepID=I1QT38_ORYGL
MAMASNNDENERREQAEKALQRAEELFAAGNVRSAHLQAGRAKRLCPSLPGVASAAAAYEVHAAARPGKGGNNWRAVLGMRYGGAATLDTIKDQFQRLSLLLLHHPDDDNNNNTGRRAAVEGAGRARTPSRPSPPAPPWRTTTTARAGARTRRRRPTTTRCLRRRCSCTCRARPSSSTAPPARASSLARWGGWSSRNEVRPVHRVAEPAVAEEAVGEEGATRRAGAAGGVPVPGEVPGVWGAVRVH